jgi:TRAP-type C4-dicarboxylate transport system permease small subunit
MKPLFKPWLILADKSGFHLYQATRWIFYLGLVELGSALTILWTVWTNHNGWSESKLIATLLVLMAILTLHHALRLIKHPYRYRLTKPSKEEAELARIKLSDKQKPNFYYYD